MYVDDADARPTSSPTSAGSPRQVDRAAYAATAPGDEHAAEAWRCSDEVAAELLRRHGRRRDG